MKKIKKSTANEILTSISKKDTGWKDKAQYYRENKEWILHSAKIASKILQILLNNKKDQKSPNSQEELAKLMNMPPEYINKILKGRENLSLKIVSNIETTLKCELISTI